MPPGADPMAAMMGGGAPVDPAQQEQQQILAQILPMLIQMLTQVPPPTQGTMGGGKSTQKVPALSLEMDPQLVQLLDIFKMAQMQAPQGQQIGNAIQGQQGAMYGAMGGRPPGS